jgi:hypothetical protein
MCNFRFMTQRLTPNVMSVLNNYIQGCLARLVDLEMVTKKKVTFCTEYQAQASF